MSNRPNNGRRQTRRDGYHGGELQKGDIVTDYPLSVISRGPRSAINVSPRHYVVLERISQSAAFGAAESSGSYGFSYKGHVLDKPSSLVFIKTPKISRDVPHSDTERILSEIFLSFMAEYQNRERMGGLNDGKHPSVAKIVSFGLYPWKDTGRGGRELLVPFLVQEFIDEPSILSYFNDDRCPHREQCQVGSKGVFEGIRTPALWFAVSEGIVQLVRRVHNRNVIHGEVVPKNILLHSSGNELHPILVDFGKSFQLDISSVAGSRVRQENVFLAPECRGYGPGWYTPADIYSLGGVLLYLATGKSPPDIMAQLPSAPIGVGEKTDVVAWKRVIHEMFSLNRGLIEKNEGIVKVIDKCLRPVPSDRYPTAERLLQALHAVDYTRVKRNIRSVSSSFKRGPTVLEWPFQGSRC